MPQPIDVTPSARRLTASLRDIGYDFVSALADLVDNSVSAAATQIDVEIVFEGERSHVIIADDGSGMTESGLNEALRFGTRRQYEEGNLGRYGLGLKTASISQCRRLTVVSRRSSAYRRLAARTLDLDHIEATDRWHLIDPPKDSNAWKALQWLEAQTGTVVIWENLDRVLPVHRPEGGWAKRRLEGLSQKAADHLGMAFHRFIEGDTPDGSRVTITVNGEKVRPWNPFAPKEEARAALPRQSFEIVDGDQRGEVLLHRYILPARHAFSSQAEWERLSGPLKWNRQQGLYIYRASRLVQAGGWCGIRAADEHTKLARAALDFPTSLDGLFRINVSKMRVALPAELRSQMERPVHELCHQADAVYRRDGVRANPKPETDGVSHPTMGDHTEISTAILAAALESGEHEALSRIINRLRQTSPAVASSLGW